MTEELAKQVDVRDSVSVIVPEAGLLMCALPVRGEELVKFQHARGHSLCIPGKWYVISLSLNGKKLGFSRAMGEYSSLVEAERACKELCRELGKRTQDAMLKTNLRAVVESDPLRRKQ